MIESEAVVVRTDDSYAWVTIRPHTPCGNCDPETGCKTVAMSRMFSKHQQEFRVQNLVRAQSGDLVTVAIAEGMLIHSAAWGYGLPLTLLLVGGLLGYALAPNDYHNLFTLIGAGGGLGVALHYLRRRVSVAIEPQILEKKSPNTIKVSLCKNNSNS